METYSYISENGTVRQIEDLLAKARNDEQDEQLRTLDGRTTALEAVKPINSIRQNDLRGVTSGACFYTMQPMASSGQEPRTLEQFHAELVDAESQTAPARFGSVLLSFEVAAGKWYNYIYIPHRNGVGGDNWRYGVLYLSEMTSDTSNIWMQHYFGGQWYTLRKLNV